MCWKRLLAVILLLLSLVSTVFLLHRMNLSNDEYQPGQVGGRANLDSISTDLIVSQRHQSVDDFNHAADININDQPVSGAAASMNNSAPTRPEHLTVSGIVADKNNRPIENALISYATGTSRTRSDENGQYQIIVELAKFENPSLHFLRSGYKGRKIAITAAQIKNGTPLRLDLNLSEAADTTSLDGWIGSDSGAGLAHRKIRITSRSEFGFGTNFYVVYSNDRGDFSFEGIKSDIPYKLEVYPTPGYPGFIINALEVTQFTPRLNIVLERLRLIDLRGRVINNEAAPVAGLTMNVENISTSFPVQKISTDSSGFFQLDGFPSGQLRFSSLAPEHFIVSGITLSENDSRNLTLVVDRGSYYLSGWVSDQNGIPLINARVTLDTNFVDGEIQSYAYRSMYTDNTGTFNFSNLGNTSHLITVYAEGFNKKQVTHRFSSPTDDVQIRVTAN